ncbi:MAG: hypothetical protein GC160_27380 [Acidobacteria bacterium]|nr:hypothetical protein [Acidobacteriota bacterium]
MAATLETKRIAHQLVDQLDPGQLEAVIQLLELLVRSEPETLTDVDRQAVATSREHFSLHPDGGVPFEETAQELGFTMEEVRGGER